MNIVRDSCKEIQLGLRAQAMVNNFSCVYGRGPILPIDMLFYHDPSTWVQIWCLERLHYAYIMDIGMYSVTKPDDIVVRETPVLSLAMPCFILIRLLDQVSATRCDGIRAIVLLNKPVQSVFVFVTRPLV